jgi:hypothetical protein
LLPGRRDDEADAHDQTFAANGENAAR